MKKFHIEIDEAQRRIMVVALKNAILSANTPENDLVELEYLQAMFAELPEVEKEHPNSIHGFCR